MTPHQDPHEFPEKEILTHDLLDSEDQRSCKRKANCKKSDLDKSKKLSKPETLTKISTCVIALCTFIYSIFAGMQWWEIRSGSTDTHALAVAAKTQAEQA